MSGCSKIRCIVRLRQMLRRWRKKAAMSAKALPSDIPAGYVAINVGTGSSCKRFVVRATYLNHPLFKKLLIQAEEEYGFCNSSGPLSIPCDEALFEDVLRFLSRSESARHGSSFARFVSLEEFQRYCHMGIKNNLEFLADSRPLLNGVSESKAIW